ncbi:class I SAM-dependent methyltransferase [Williamsia sp. MIQD14]|uniref:class I SAM-dependent methyltransferase n=1 Tax=Williamsia sp. MIQD14 TaxID=3425703 RepID=UPI003DA0739B
MAADGVTQQMWARGRYEAVGERIAGVAAELVATVDDLRPLQGREVVDLACGTGSVALAAARAGARVTGVDITADLLGLAAAKADAAQSEPITWVRADASATGLPDDSADVVLSSMGIIFVEPRAQVAEIARLLRSDGTLGFTSWVRATHNPFYDPIVSVLGPPRPADAPAGGDHSPDDWGVPDTIRARLAGDFDTVEIDHRVHTWRFGSLETAMHFISEESPMHVDVLHRVSEIQHDRLLSAFEVALAPHTDTDGVIAFDSPYVVVTARRR